MVSEVAKILIFYHRREFSSRVISDVISIFNEQRKQDFQGQQMPHKTTQIEKR